MVNAPSNDQKVFAAKSLTKAIGQICDCWDAVIEASWDRGYQVNTGDSGSSKGEPSDPTGNLAAMVDVHPDKADAWLSSARSNLATLVQVSSVHIGGLWTGPFHPPRMRSALIQAAQGVVEMWPKNAEKLFSRIEKLGSEAMRYWPPTPEAGTVIDGVTVAQRSAKDRVEVCVECNQPIAGGAIDPVRRIDGDPYHATSCYYRKWRRNKSSATDLGTAQQPA